jgi:hypothetical protein
VIGVMPPGFKFMRKADALLPQALDAQRVFAIEGMSLLGCVIGRLKRDATPDQARSELDLILQRLKKASPRRNYGSRAIATPLGERLTGGARGKSRSALRASARVIERRPRHSPTHIRRGRRNY